MCKKAKLENSSCTLFSIKYGHQVNTANSFLLNCKITNYNKIDNITFSIETDVWGAKRNSSKCYLYAK